MAFVQADMFFRGGEFPPQEPGAGATLSLGCAVIVDIEEPAFLRTDAKVGPSLTPRALGTTAAHRVGRTSALGSNLRLAVAMPVGQHLCHSMRLAPPFEGIRRGRLFFERKAVRQGYSDFAANEFHRIQTRSRSSPAHCALFDRLLAGKAEVERDQIGHGDNYKQCRYAVNWSKSHR